METELQNLQRITPTLTEQYDGLPVYIVGGAVRDALIGRDPTDIDLMVCEVSREEMLDRGFKEIDSPNNDTFAVFLDNEGREVAIAREEIRIESPESDNPHHAFEVTPVPADVRALEAVKRDMRRRDFTINAMAYDARHATLHDPQNGRLDLMRDILRHVDDSFRDDPLRILRGARFAARYDFELAYSTIRAMNESAEGLRDLPGERIRMEMEKALAESKEPRRFFDILKYVGALKYAFPELYDLVGVPAGPAEYHNEGDSYEHTMLVMEEMNDLMPNDERGLLMALTHDLGKAATPSSELPAHHGHGESALSIIESMADRLALTNEQRMACREGAFHHMRLKDIDEMNDSTLYDTWRAVRNEVRLARLMVADAQGREPAGEYEYLALLDAWQRASDAFHTVTASDLMDDGHHPDEMGGKEFGDLLRQRRIEVMRSFA